MIDYQLIEQATQDLTHSIKNKKQIAPGLFALRNVFSEDTISKLQQYISTASNNDWQLVENQENQERKKITWKNDSIIEELHIAVDNTTSLINKIFPHNKKHNFLGVSVWHDYNGYYLDWHTDNPIITVSMQIYLFEHCDKSCGTTFEINGQHYTVEYEHNQGYICEQTVHKPKHKTSCALPPGQNRYSFYTIWSEVEKSSG